MWAIFGFLGPDSQTQLNPDPKHCLPTFPPISVLIHRTVSSLGHLLKYARADTPQPGQQSPALGQRSCRRYLWRGGGALPVGQPLRPQAARPPNQSGPELHRRFHEDASERHRSARPAPAEPQPVRPGGGRRPLPAGGAASSPWAAWAALLPALRHRPRVRPLLPAAAGLPGSRLVHVHK